MIPNTINREESNPTIKDIEALKIEFQSTLEEMLIEFELKTRTTVKAINIESRYYFGQYEDDNGINVPHYSFSNRLVLEKV